MPFCFFILDSEFWLLNSCLLWFLVLSFYSLVTSAARYQLLADTGLKP
jgi:hypothetical protein